MVDDDDANTDTVRAELPLPSVNRPPEDAGSAATALQTPFPLPPPPSVAGTLPPTRPLRLRPKPDAGASIDLDGSRYAIGQLLGQGGMGEVLLAYDDHIGRDVAIKRIRADVPSEEERSRFVREARVQGRLEHPAVVPVHDLAVDRNGKPFFVMKRLTGTEMHELLKRLRTGDEPDAPGCRRRLLRAFADVCLAVEFAHSRGVIHRDLKPANIMLGDFGEVYVLDWGVARALAAEPGSDDAPPSQSIRRERVTASGEHDLALDSGDTQVGTILGTPAYMAPEQLVGEPAGPAADIYALGCILFEIAANESLHPRSRSIGTAYAAVDARPSQRRPDSPPELDAVCERATRNAPGERYASARALGAAVQAFLDGDRDLAVRRELAQHHIAQAREALARSHGEADRRAAMQAAGRALALDPTAAEAADLVTRLMLEPPAGVPAEVEHRLATIDTDTARSQGRLAAIAVMGYLAFVPLLVWTGVRDATAVVAFALVAMISGVQLFVLSRRDRISPPAIYASACVNALLIAIVCRMVGPFIIAPTLVISTLMSFASHPQFGRIRVLAVILGAAVVVPWGLELLGVLASTYRFDAGTIVLSSPVLTFSSVPTQLAFALLLVSLIGVVAVLSRALATRQRDATRALEVQAWHLRQIVATAAR